MDTSSEKEAIKLFIHTTWISDLLKQNRSSTSSKKLIVTNVNITSCNGTPLQYSCLENPADGAAWKAAVQGVTEGWTRLSDFTFTFSFSCIGEGNGTPLQCSCLENPRDRGAWWAAVYGVTQSRTRLTRLSSSSSSISEAGPSSGNTIDDDQRHRCPSSTGLCIIFLKMRKFRDITLPKVTQ